MDRKRTAGRQSDSVAKHSDKADPTDTPFTLTPQQPSSSSSTSSSNTEAATSKTTSTTAMPATGSSTASTALTNSFNQPVPRAQQTAKQESDDNFQALLHLACCRLSPRQLSRLLHFLEQPAEIFDPVFKRFCHKHSSLSTIPGRIEAARSQVEQAQQWAQHRRCFLVSRDSSNYPALLRQIPDPPAMLFVSGEVNRLSDRQIAIVGSRKSSAPARSITRRWASELARAGVTITSGLARGIDAAAHQGALDARDAGDDRGSTIAVMATGPDRCYPANHQALRERIIESGCTLTEFPPGTTPIARNFPQRNRLISGLSSATLVIEAGLRSGTLITARHALEQDREVLAMPGSIMNPQSAGSHQLIQQGAGLIHQASDVLNELGWPAAASPDPAIQQAQPIQPLADTSDNLLDAIGYDPFTAETLAVNTGREISAIMATLQWLELEGKLTALGDGRYVSTIR